MLIATGSVCTVSCSVNFTTLNCGPDVWCIDVRSMTDKKIVWMQNKGGTRKSQQRQSFFPPLARHLATEMLAGLWWTLKHPPTPKSYFFSFTQWRGYDCITFWQARRLFARPRSPAWVPLGHRCRCHNPGKRSSPVHPTHTTGRWWENLSTEL